MKCYREGGCGPYEMYSCAECPASKPEYATRWKGKTVRTNADHIRSLSDQQLSEFLSKPWCENHRFKDECLRFETDCQACLLEWLQKPYEEDE